MINGLKKSLILSAAIAAPLFISAPAMGSTGSNEVNQQAVKQFTSSVRDTLSAFDYLERGDFTSAKSNLDQALRGLESAIAKDPTLGFSQKSGTAFHNDLKMVKAKMSSGDRNQAKSELTNLLRSAGIITNS